MNNEDEPSSLLTKLRHFLQVEPQNKEELINLLRDAHLRALINSDTFSMLEGVIQLAQIRVRDIMLPKNQMTCIPYQATFEEIMKIITRSGHSRFPVINECKDEILGILHAKDLLYFQVSPETEFDLNDVMRQAIFIPESRRLDLLLREFRNTRNHMAIVVDEYGTVDGFVTIEDIIEQVVGDIEDEFDIDEEVYIKSHGDRYYIIKAQTPIKAFNEVLNAELSDLSYDTVGGILMAQFGYLPARGETITIESFEFKIINADSRRIKLVSCQDKRSNTQTP